MLKTLYGKLSLALLGIFLLLNILLIAVIDRSAKRFQDETAQKLHLNLAQNIVKETSVWKVTPLTIAR